MYENNNEETEWKREYVLNQVSRNHNPTIYLIETELTSAIAKLLQLTSYESIEQWLEENLTPVYAKRMKSAIRMRRYRQSSDITNVELRPDARSKLDQISSQLNLPISNTVSLLCDHYAATHNDLDT